MVSNDFCVFVRVCMRVYIYGAAMLEYVCMLCVVYIRMCFCMYAYVHVYMCIHTYIHTYIYMHTYIHAHRTSFKTPQEVECLWLPCMHVCMHTYTVIQVHTYIRFIPWHTYIIHTYIHTYIQDFSQYPQEVEYLWVPCSFVAPAGSERKEVTKKGVVRIVPVKVSSNLTARTLDEMLVSKKYMHLAAYRYALQELQYDLSQMCKVHGARRLESDMYKTFRGTKYTCEDLIDSILKECRERLEVHDLIEADRYANDETFRRLVTEMLDVKTMAKSKIWLWIEDPSETIMELKDVPLRDAHRKLLTLLQKKMELQVGEARMDTAKVMCRLKGLIVNNVDEVDDLNGDTKLESAIVDGVKTEDLELLLEAAGLTRGGDSELAPQTLNLSQAVAQAAKYGHVHCIKVLLAVNANVSIKDRDGTPPIFLAGQNGHVDAVRVLRLQGQADVNATDKEGRTTLFIAARNGHVGVVTTLLAFSADTNLRADNGFTPLCAASQQGQRSVVELLFAHGGIEALMTTTTVRANVCVFVFFECRMCISLLQSRSRSQF
jgi:hypothetical protein